MDINNLTMRGVWRGGIFLLGGRKHEVADLEESADGDDWRHGWLHSAGRCMRMHGMVMGWIFFFLGGGGLWPNNDFQATQVQFVGATG